MKNKTIEEQLSNIFAKAKKVALAKSYADEKNFDCIKIYEGYLSAVFSYTCYGEYTEDEIVVHIDDLDKSVDELKKEFALEIEEEQRKKEEEKKKELQKQKEINEKREYTMYLNLKEKYGK